MEHSRRGPSGAYKWSRCLGSPAAEAQYPDALTHLNAEGTAAHFLREMCRKYNRCPSEYEGETIAVYREEVGQGSYKTHTIFCEEPDRMDLELAGINPVFFYEVDDEMVEAIKLSLAMMDDLFPDEVLAEETLPIGPLFPGEIGTVDEHGIIWGKNKVTVALQDFKYGGLLIGDADAEEGPEQVMLYGYSVYNKHRDKIGDREVEFILQICQPRREHYPQWKVSLTQILVMAEHLSQRKLLSEQIGAPRTPGPIQCRMCKHRPNCAEFAQYSVSLVGFDPKPAIGYGEVIELADDPILPAIESLTPEQRTYIYMHKEVINKFLADLTESLTKDYMEGRPTPGLKLVTGRLERTWHDPKAAEAFLIQRLGAAKAVVRKPISPAQAEQLLSPLVWKKAETMVKKSRTKEKLVLLSSKKQAIVPVASMFDNLDEAPDDGLDFLD